ncbi:hypothetical protein [Leptospira weilii]|uniref:hypothetical protein n=1 Tax=Leptospira weilii TaxID=28184 RepID=UPI00115AC5C8|nr:hypothetical protein [Leptospira weilii]QDK22348.1 hypothetical protein FHG67_06105 [Leptospira weilii]QDK26291.1 hypothetical protein FHG68_06025 [Leptospira weilii]
MSRFTSTVNSFFVASVTFPASPMTPGYSLNKATRFERIKQVKPCDHASILFCRLRSIRSFTIDKQFLK